MARGLTPQVSGLLVLCDMDGVLYRGHEEIPGAVTAIRTLLDAGHTVCYATNNGWTPLSQLVERLARMGIPTDEQHMVGSSWMAAELYRRRYPDATRPFAVGGTELRRQLRRVGARPVAPFRHKEADSLVVGLDLTFSYSRLARAQAVGLRGVPFMVTDADGAYPWQDGWLPGTGAILASIERACGRVAINAGKPESSMYEELANRFRGVRDVIVVGDNLDSDIAAGNRFGVPTVMVLTGISSAAEAAARPVPERPQHVIASIADLPALLGG